MNIEQKKNVKGFTLIELLVVVSIIALLVSILMPALSKAREAGRRAVCGSNLHTIGNMAHQYAVENKDFLWPQFTHRRTLRPDRDSFVLTDPATWNSDYRPRLNVVVFQLRVHVHEMLKKSYAMNDEIWVCPSQLIQERYLLDEVGRLRPNGVLYVDADDPIEDMFNESNWTNRSFCLCMVS